LDVLSYYLLSCSYVLVCWWLQMDALRRGVDVVVGTPGRVMDLLERKRLIGDKVGAAWDGCSSTARSCIGAALVHTIYGLFKSQHEPS
jgi:hypothetical protein